MKLGIVGSRSIQLHECEKIILEQIKKLHPSCIVSGGAAGVDSHVADIAEGLSIPFVVFRPEWKLGKHAGLLRNSQIAKESDIVLAIFAGVVRSGGTADTVKKAKKMGKKVIEVFLKPFKKNSKEDR